jgi:hypothetical protein
MLSRQSKSDQVAAAVRAQREAQNPPRRALTYGGNQAALRCLFRTAPRIQAKLQVGATNDPLEAEADQVADHVMRMTEPPAPTTQSSSGMVQRMCTECQKEKEEEKSSVQRKPAAATDAGGPAPASVPQALRSGGKPLGATTRQFFEPRLGVNLSGVRIHNDAQADKSARDIGARAYTVGSQIVFSSEGHEPESEAQLPLLAHELAHVVQQGGATQLHIQRTCRTGAECSAPIPGDTGRNSEEAAKQEAAKKIASGGSPTDKDPLCKAPRHKERAVNLRKLAEQNGASLPSNFAGIFINGCLEDISDGELVRCSEMSGGAPVGAGPDQFCIGVSTRREDEAAALLKKNPKTDKENNRATDITSIVIHEVQHAKFEEKAGTIVLPGADCNLKTVIYHSALPAPTGTDSTVSDYLSEISAEIAEFAPYFKANKDRPGTGAAQHMEDEETNVVDSKGESIRGDITALQCKCECATVDKWVESTFKDATGAWAPAQKDEFQRAMTKRMPTVWPKSLQKT